MGDIVNLKLARKRKARVEKEERAASNRLLFGRTKAEKTSLTAERQRATTALDGHKLEADSEK